jgi:hypothetical protein
MAMTIKTLVCPRRRRKVPEQFSWVDQRLVRDRHICGCGTEALALYLLLVTVADAEGLSYYSDSTAAQLLSMEQPVLRRARGDLVGAGLIAYRKPLYQVLSLEPDTSAGTAADVRAGGPASFAKIFQGMIGDAP